MSFLFVALPNGKALKRIDFLKGGGKDYLGDASDHT